MRFFALSSLLAFAQFSRSQFVEPPTDLKHATGYLNLPVRYKEVPQDTCNLPAGVRSYSGFVDVDQDTHMYFWFFEATEDPENAPLTVYLDGGPGYPAEPAVYVDLGLCNNDKETSDKTNLPYAWNKLTNVLIIDQPNQVGFSYSHPTRGYFDDDGFEPLDDEDDCPDGAKRCGTYSDWDPNHTANSTWAAAPTVWKTVQGFLGAFKQYSGDECPVHIATISYGGHFGPVFGQYFVEQNDKIDSGDVQDAQKLNLTTLFIANGWIDPQLQYAGYYNYTVSPGSTYDFGDFPDNVQKQMYKHEYGTGGCWDQIQSCYDKGTNKICSNADTYCAYNVQATFDNNTDNCDGYDPNDDTCEDDLATDWYIPDPTRKQLNDPSLLKVLGVFTNWTLDNVVSSYAFAPTGDDARSTLDAMKYLVNKGVYVVTYFGDRDYNCNWLGGEAVAGRLDAPGWKSSEYANLTTNDNEVHGQVKQSSNYAFARIYQSGHVVPYWQPLAAFTMFDRAIHGLDLAEGKGGISGYSSKGSKKSTYYEGSRGLGTPEPGMT